MKHTVPFAIVMAFILFACNDPTSPSSSNNDAYEPDNVYTSATPITVNDPGQNHILTPDDQDWFSFKAIAGQSYSIATTGKTPTYLELYGRNGTTLLHGTENFDADGNASISWSCDTAGTYFFKVRGYAGENAGGYSVSATTSSISMQPDAYEPDDSIGLATKLTVSIYSDLSQSHTITANDKDWFVFNANKGTGFALTIYNNQLSLVVELYNKTGTVLLVRDTVSTSIDSLKWICDSTGSYFVKIRGLTSQQVGGYSLAASTFTPVLSDSYEPDDDAAHATLSVPDSSTYSSTYKSHTLTLNDQDWVKFNAVKDGRYTIYTSGSTDTYLELYGRDGRTLLIQNDDSAGNGNAGIIWTCDTAGTYYFKVRGFNSKVSGSYNLYFSVVLPPPADSYEPDNDTGHATSILPSSSLSQIHTLPRNDQDWFKFTAIAGTNYIIQATSSSINTVLELVDRNGVAVLRRDTLGNVIAWTDTVGGVYYFRVRGRTSSDIGSYSVYFQTNGVSFSLPDGYEPDNVYTTATNLAVNGTPQAHTLTASDLDWFSFNATAGVTYNLQISGPTTGTALVLYDRNGTTSLASNYSSLSSNVSLTWTCTTSGTYYFYVSGYYSSNIGNYSASVIAIVQDSYEPDNTMAAAKAITINGAAQNHTLTNSDQDWLSFNATAGVSYTFSLSGSVNAYIDLDNSSGLNIDYGDIYQGTSSPLVWTCTSTGTYYLNIYGISTSSVGAYSVTATSN